MSEKKRTDKKRGQKSTSDELTIRLRAQETKPSVSVTGAGETSVTVGERPISKDPEQTTH